MESTNMHEVQVWLLNSNFVSQGASSLQITVHVHEVFYVAFNMHTNSPQIFQDSSNIR